MGLILGDKKKEFEKIVIAYQDKVYALSYQLTGNHADAQDLAQEVFVRAYLNLEKFRFEADLGTWLHRITVNVYLNSRRKNKKDNIAYSLDEPLLTEEGEVSRDLAATGSDPQEVLAEKEKQRYIRQALENLPPEYRAVLVLREFQGLNYEDIAKVLGCSLGTVKSRLNRARQALKEKVAELEGEGASKLKEGKAGKVAVKRSPGEGYTRP
ncbi:sigma-70 family RNA polymerase sigma factor [Thermanaeromonas toyohensis]|uniref:sigma-70 family RNA polymerase sigma factor n=1 Tax=Thermanaeromonas toyohensis TaxID=161154 RepID=UPI001E456C09|nr:sigma-70 family RNA polymerase sigma factor [Thermanaeromonas toyohensis]